MYCSHCGKPVTVPENADNLSILVKKARAGDRGAVAALYEKTYSQVFYTVKSMIKDEDAVFDILQDSCIKAFSHLDRFEGNTRFLPWVKQIAANTARDWLKKKKPMLFVELESENERDIPVEDRFVDERASAIPEQVIDQQETTCLIRKIIDDLPEDQRAVIGMFYYEKLSVKQISTAMDVSESAVKSRLMYGRKKIEAKVRELEKKGTKLYSLAPIPFLLLLFRSQKAYAAELPPDGSVLQAVLEGIGEPCAGTAAASGVAGTAKAAAGGLGVAKIALIALASAALIGVGVFGVSRLSRENSETEPPAVTEPAISEPEPASTEEPTPKQTEEPAEEPEDPVADALEQYHLIVGQAAAYQYDPDSSTTPTGNYRYALVQIQPEDTVPTLLLEQETTDYLYFARVFRYDPESTAVIEADGSLMEGMTLTGGYRGGISMQGDGNGIRVLETSSGTGQTQINRVTLDGNSLKIESQWSGRIDTIPAELGFFEIVWHDVGDTAALDSWTLGEITQPGTVEGSGGETALPEDGDRIVLTGTLNEYSYEETIELQGWPDPNGQWSDHSQTFWIIVLDAPQTIEIMSGADPELISGETSMISVPEPAGLEQYAGQHLTFSIDPQKTWWKSDTSMPLAPWTNDINILNSN